MRSTILPGLLASALLAPACVLAPQGLDDERSRADAAGAAWSEPAERRELPELGERPGWRPLLERAFLANGELEAAWHEWRMALARVTVASSWPNADLELGFEHAFSDENMKTFDRQTFELGFDPMELELPTKVRTQGRAALAQARAAGERFHELKFDLQRRVLGAWLEFALLAERARIEAEGLGLLELRARSAANALQAGGMQAELLAIELEARMSEDALARTRAQLAARRAELNALLARAPDAPLEPPEELPEARPLAADDARLLAVGAARNRELAALAHEVAGREEALALARQQFLPDVGGFLGFTGSVEQFVGLSLALPSNFAMLRAEVEEARADFARSSAALRQARSDRAGAFVAGLVLLRDSERQVAFLGSTVLPLAERVRASSEAAYAGGLVRFSEWLDAQQALLDVRLALAEARVARERQLSELEALAGTDFETLTDAEAVTHG